MLFYFLLFFAAVTSSTSILEGTVAFLVEEKGWERKKALVGCCIVMEIVGIMYVLSQVYMNIKGIWISRSGIEFPIFGDFLEYLTDRLLLWPRYVPCTTPIQLSTAASSNCHPRAAAVELIIQN